jgi:hypothetical protein
LKQLNDLGYGDLTGFKIVQSENKDRIEKFTQHPLNGSFSGRERDNRQSFWNSPAFTLQKTNEKAQTLTSLIDYTGDEVSSCTMGIFENRLGGRICVAGDYPDAKNKEQHGQIVRYGMQGNGYPVKRDGRSIPEIYHSFCGSLADETGGE